MGPSYNNSFGNSQMPGGVPAGGIGSGMAGAGGTAPVISSGSGDIVLAPSGNRQGGGKKWLLAVVVVLFVVAVVTGVAAVIVGNGGGSVKLKEFNELANYALYGKESNAGIDWTKVDADDNDYKVTEKLEYQDEAEKKANVQYYEKLDELKNNFMTAYNNAGVSGEKATVTADNISGLVTFLENYVKTSDPSLESLMKLYGKDEAYIKNYVDGYYRVFTEGKDEYSQQYGAIKTETLRLTANILAKYDLLGACASENANAQKCQAVSGSVPEEERLNMATTDKYTKDAANMAIGFSRQLTYYITEMAKILEGKK